MKINHSFFSSTILAIKNATVGRAVCLRTDTSRCGVISEAITRHIPYSFGSNNRSELEVRVTYSDGSRSSWLHPSSLVDLQKYQGLIEKLQENLIRCRLDAALAIEHIQKDQK